MKKILIALMAVMLSVGLLGLGTFAYFTDTQTTPENTFTAGTLKLDAGGINSFAFDIPNMAPGDITGDYEITIENAGSLDLFWLADWQISGGNKLREAIYIEYAQMEFIGWNEPTDNFIENGVGAGLYPGWYNTLAGMSPFNVVTLNNWDGNNGMGTTPWEHVGALKPGNSYRLTLRFGFAPEAGNEFQGTAAAPINVKIAVIATQVNAGAIAAIPGWTASPAYWVNWANGQLNNQP
jgi:predicted ribosomally synthesized peptide with SipW-like signal peptide